ncbi:MAG: hypothetical protein RM347_031595 [Nostoc sp. ChiQUE02]|uniref:hypothetical protein n=1 Tax=Nostoc sp. ChiQUE02 TaxID=3075377 RepID=UPI002AD35FFF|nr:hypothetical protein [Nostoc sp. ChiQUE02]MDZ8234468.1 hypothetical protein [Nostoc sp. ChiQUE02]
MRPQDRSGSGSRRVETSDLRSVSDAGASPEGAKTTLATTEGTSLRVRGIAIGGNRQDCDPLTATQCLPKTALLFARDWLPNTQSPQ